MTQVNQFDTVQPEQGGKDVQGESAIIADQDSGLRKAVEDQEQMLRLGDFLKRSVVTLSSLGRNENGMIAESLAGFRQTVLRGAALEEMEIGLAALKKAMSWSEEEAEETPAKETPAKEKSEGIWGKLRKRVQPAQENGRANGSYHKGLQSIFLSITAEFDQDLGEVYLSQVTRLRQEIENSTEMEDLMALRDDILGVIQAYNRIIDEERSQITDFISEIGSGLIEVERQYLNSMSHSGQGQTENTQFNSMLDTHLEDMKRSAQLNTTLAEFRSMVMSRLASIRTALEEKRRAEVLRQETLNEEMESLQQNLTRMKKEVDQVHEKRKALEKEILIDPLTGVANRRALKERMQEEIQRYQRYEHFFSVMLFDVDNFKSINDTFGHWAGDKCLKEIIKRIKPVLRETDFLARWGGDEFVALFPGTERESAAAVAERIRKSLENTRFTYHKQEIKLTVSIGLTEVQASDQSQEMLFNRVDKAMYKAKKKGRNMVASL